MINKENPTINLSDIYREFLKYAPAYAQKEAQIAISKVMELQSQGVIRNGLYYIVLVDLVGSTKYSAEYGNEKTAKRIENFITASFDALNSLNIVNIGLFIKEIGDAVLYIFQHFPDIIRWRAEFGKVLSLLNSNDEPSFHIRTCVHIGEVSLEGVNPLSLAVSQTFKMEKTVDSDQVVLTEPAYTVAWPTIARAYHGFQLSKAISLDGFPKKVPLYRLIADKEDDFANIVSEYLD